MTKLLAYPLTALYLVCFGLVLAVFHPVQWFCLNVFGYEAHKRSVSLLNLAIMRCTHILGTRYSIEFPENMPQKGPLIIVTNHQSMYDIPPPDLVPAQIPPQICQQKRTGQGHPQRFV